MPADKQVQKAPPVVRAVRDIQVIDADVDDGKVRRTLASFCGLTVNTYIMWIFTVSPQNEASVRLTLPSSTSASMT